MKQKLKLKQNYLLMMVLCCILPLAIILLAIQYFGLSRNYAWWAVLLLCPLTHYFMMRNMHKSHSDIDEHTEKKLEVMKLWKARKRKKVAIKSA